MALSLRAQLASLKRELVSSKRWVNILLEVRSHEGELVFSCGGCWDRVLNRYVEPPDGFELKPHVVRLKKSQLEGAREICNYIIARINGDDARPVTLMAIGDRGGGKTWLMALFLVVVALVLAGAYQMCVNLNAKNKAEVDDAIKAICPAEWIREEVTDPKDPKIEFVTRSWVFWMTGKNPGAMRMGQLKFENVLINEAQDQSVKVFANALGAIRTGGCVSIATNGSQGQGGDWVVMLHQAIKSGEAFTNEFHGRDGVTFVLTNKENDAVHQPTMTKAERLLRAVDPEAAAVDFGGVIKLSGDLGYPGFSRLPYYIDAAGKPAGGHVGDPPKRPDIGEPLWKDVTRQITKFKAGSEYDWLGLSDFQKNPGCCVTAAKVFEDHRGALVLYCAEFITTQGRELDLSQALVDRRYFPGHVDTNGREAPGRSMVIIGDATGDRQSSSHRRDEPYSWKALREAGDWTIVPPDRFWKSRLPRNPEVDDSRKQMHALFLNYQILVSPKCGETPRQQTHDGVAGFPSLIEGFARTKVYPSGAFVKRGHFTHGPDGVRYGAWCVMPRPQLVETLAAHDERSFEALMAIRGQSSE